MDSSLRCKVCTTEEVTILADIMSRWSQPDGKGYQRLQPFHVTWIVQCSLCGHRQTWNRSLKEDHAK